MDSDIRDYFSEVEETQQLFDFVLSNTIKRVVDLEYRVGNLWVGTNQSRTEDLNRKCQNLSVELLCQKDKLAFFEEKLEENFRYKVKIGKLFKKTYKRCNRFDKKLKHFWQNLDNLADNTITILTKQQNKQDIDNSDLDKIIKSFQNIKLVDY